jgi:AGZA family xanthine/uracil permease-like MFS transporter
VALGLIPSLAAWALVQVEITARKAGTSLFELAPRFGNDLFIYGLIALSQGFILTAMVLAAMLALIIDRAFLKAAYWAIAGAVLSAIGLIHAYTLTPQGVQNNFEWLGAPHFVAGYALTACVLVGLHYREIRMAVDKPVLGQLGGRWMG